MSNIHTATLPDGTTAKRTSLNRTYTHAIAVGPTPKSVAADRITRSIENAAREIARYRAILAYLNEGGELVLDANTTTVHAPGLRGGHRLTFLYSHKGETTLEQARERMISDYSGFIESLTESNFTRTEDLAEVEAGPDFIGGWVVRSWAGRPDLAAKAEATMRAGFPHHEVRSIPATVVVK